MARWLNADTAPIYSAAKAFVDRALATDDSLFTPGRPIWSADVLNDLHERFAEHPDESSDRFEVKFQRQLAEAPDETIQLAAECLFVYFLIALNINGSTKRELVRRVLGWMAQPVDIPGDLDAALEHGIASVGIAFHTYRPFQLIYLIEVARRCKALDSEARDAVLTDPWAFRQIAYDVQVRASHSMRESLLHLVHPDTFERITSRDLKQRIAGFYRARVTTPDQNVDRQLLEIRERLAEDFGASFDYWDDDVLVQWQPPKNSRWGQFVFWARRFYDDGIIDTEERGYKYVIAEHLQAARDAMLADDSGWIELLRKSFGSPNNITFHITHARFLDWVQEHPDTARLALLAIWDDRRTISERIRGFATHLPNTAVKGVGTRLNLAAFLNMATDLERNPPYRARAFHRAYDLTGYARAPQGSDEAVVYEHALAFLDAFDKEASDRGFAMRDRLDAQSAVWCVTYWDPPESWHSSDRNAFKLYTGKPADPDDEVDEPDGIDPPQSLDELGNALLLDGEYLTRMDRLLKDKGQVIFYGPPGTGKTYVARKLAEFYSDGDPNAVTLVQFHPSYAYEDFVEGFRPAEVGGQPGFQIAHGPLRRIAAAAGDRPDVLHVLIIDEINRGNVAKVFGELYFLLEYRKEDIALQYSPAERFGLPANLLIIGTMNTADRSIALVDAALRRRFYFIPFFPDEAPIEGLLHRWLDRHNPDMRWVAGLLDLANSQLHDRQFAIGPSHFMREDLDDEWVELIWQHSILPLLAEQFVGGEDRLTEFELDRMKARLLGPTELLPSSQDKDKDETDIADDLAS